MTASRYSRGENFCGYEGEQRHLEVPRLNQPMNMCLPEANRPGVCQKTKRSTCPSG